MKANGLTTQYIAVTNDIINAGDVSVDGTTLYFSSYKHEDQDANNWDGKGAFASSMNPDGTVNYDNSVTKLSLNNAAFNLYNGYTETVNLAGYSSNNSYVHIDLDPTTGTADVLNINGNVEGTTKLVVYASTTDLLRKSVLFAQSTNDTTGNANSFSIYRIYNSPYMYDIVFNTSAGENGNNNSWSFGMNNESNDYAGYLPDPDAIPEAPEVSPSGSLGRLAVAPEVIAFSGLQAAGLEQTRTLVSSVSEQVKNNRYHTRSCGFVDSGWNGKLYRNVWVNPSYYKSHTDSLFDVDSEIWGVEAGGDIQYDMHNRLGLFLSYRDGE